jgi:hypothetical protein
VHRCLVAAGIHRVHAPAHWCTYGLERLWRAAL